MTSVHPAREKLATLSKEKTELLKLLRERRLRGTHSVRRVPREDGSAQRFLASWAQQRLWFIDRLEGAGAPYVIPMALRLRGTLDREALQRALNVIVQRHEVLRTVLVDEGGDPKQKIGLDAVFALKSVDLSGHAQAERDARLSEEKAHETREPFDLATGPSIRGRLLRLQSDEHVLLVTMHHIVSDGWSVGIFLRELAALYAGESLEPLPIQYVDYAQWQRDWLAGELFAKQLAYWRARLAGAPAHLELPTDRPRPAVPSYRGGSVEIVLDDRLSAKLRAFAQRREMTPFMILYAAWAILLSRLSGQQDMSIGTPVANRRLPELEGLIGFFVNTLVLRVEVCPDLSIEDFLEQVKEATLGAYDRQDVPFEQLVETLKPPRALNRNPLFQVLFALQSAPQGDFELPGLATSAEDAAYEFSKFDLELTLEDAGGRIGGALHFASDLFDRGTVERWMGCFREVLSEIAEERVSRVDDLPMLPECQRHELLDVFNTPAANLFPRKLIHELFEDQAARTPDALAVVFGGDSLTYAELNRRANRLAWQLRSQGVGPDSIVGICVGRGLDMAVGLLGTLKAGGAYVPVDPVYPRERLTHMLRDSGAVAVLAQAGTRESFELPPGCSLVSLEEMQREPAGAQADASADCNPLAAEVGLTEKNLAYVIYTSGSTGSPKGVMVAHANVRYFLEGLEACIHGAPPDCRRVAWNSSFGFDMAVKAWGQLLRGRTVYPVPEEVRLSAADLVAFVEEHAIDAMECTPSHLRLMRAGGFLQGSATSLRKLLLGGEPIDAQTWRALSASAGTGFFNMYGPTECSVDASCGPIVGEVPHVGRPMPNARIYILDARRRIVPVGAVGEIYIAGAGVARGYLNRPALTDERFVPDPYSSDPRARMYKTGDLGRWRSDGTIAYVGRNDDQVKIRGYRIELGEIERQLERHVQVKDAVVVALDEAAQKEKRLVAYVAKRNADAPSPAGLREHLKASLPEHMIPTAFVVLETWPLTPNGKLDRRALPPPQRADYPSAARVAPENEIERALASIWQELLGVEEIGRHDNFFELGGHSLHGTKLVAKVAERFAVTLPVTAIFQAPTVREMAQAVESRSEPGRARLAAEESEEGAV